MSVMIVIALLIQPSRFPLISHDMCMYYCFSSRLVKKCMIGVGYLLVIDKMSFVHIYLM